MAVLAALSLGGCAAGLGSGASLRSVSRGEDLAMTADYRMVYKRMRGDRPVMCAEPSPDIGRIVSAASNLSLTGSAKGLEKVQPELALAFAASRAEGLAQLGQRLATIQLLRDSTYRACEAYANEAISAATYAMIVSRYDDVMVTLLLGEMAANSARPSGAALLGGTAATTGLGGKTAEAAVSAALDRMAKATTALEDAVASRGRLKADAGEADKTGAQQAVAAAQREYDEASAVLKASLQAVGGAQASVVAGNQPAVPPNAPSIEVAAQLARMQKGYLDDFNLDAVTVGCLSALSQLDYPQTGTAGSAKTVAKTVSPDAAASSSTQGVASSLVPQGAATTAAGESRSFVSTTVAGAYSFQDECRAVLLNGQTLRAVARGRLEQIAADRNRPDPDGR